MSGSDLETVVRELVDRDAISRVPKLYARGVDRRDWELVRSCFAKSALIEGSRTSAPLEEYLATLIPGVEFYPRTMHFMGNQLVDVNLDGDADRGRVETYAVAYHWMAAVAGAPDPANLIVGVRYHDTLARADGGWQIVHRHVDPDWRVGEYQPV
jgi:hypothetical protein